jgi:hypothetical protein
MGSNPMSVRPSIHPKFPKTMTFQKLFLFKSSHRKSTKRCPNVATLNPYTSTRVQISLHPLQIKIESIIQFKNTLASCIPLNSISKQVGSIHSPDTTTQHHISPHSTVDPVNNGPLTYGFWKYWTKSVGSEILVCNGNI